MAGNKYLTVDSTTGRAKEVASVQASAGAGDAGKVVALDAAGRLHNTMMPVGIGADTQSIVTSENLSAGNLVNIYNNTGTATARKADATTVGKEAHGFVLASTTSPAAATVYFEGTIIGLSGLTPGNQFLTTTPGLSDETPPSASGNIIQSVGTATSATTLNFERGQVYELA